MRIVIDMQGAQSENRYRGIGRYTISFAQALVRHRGEHEIILALNGLFPDTIEPIRAAFNGLLPQENIRVWYAPGPVSERSRRNMWRREVAERIREAFLTSLRPDVVHLTSFFEGWNDDAVTSLGVFAPQLNTVVTLYNLNPLFNPDNNLQLTSVYEHYKKRKIDQLSRARAYIHLSDPPILRSDESGAPSLQHTLGKTYCSAGVEACSENALASSNQNLKNNYDNHINSTWSENARKAIVLFERLLSPVDDNFQNDCSINTLIQNIGAISNASASAQDIITTAWAIATNHPVSRQKKLYVDISDLIQKDLRTGIQRVTRSIIIALLNNPPENYKIEPVYASFTSKGYFHARKYTQQLAGKHGDDLADQLIEPQPGDLFLGLDYVAGIVKAQEPYLKWMRNHGVSVYFVVYDLLPIKLPHAFLQGVATGHHQWLQIISEFDGAICISQAVQSDLDVWLKEFSPERFRPFKTAWFHLGADVDNSMPTKGLPQNALEVLNGLSSRVSFLMVGTLEPRKGHAQVLASFDQLWKTGRDINLIIVGKAGWMSESLIDKLRNNIELNNRLFWLEGVSDEYLERIYASSTCLIAASEDEGFGLPLIEAAQHNLPIIARDIAVFREVAGEYAYYFADKEPEAFANAVNNWLELYENEQHPKSDAMPWLTWEGSAIQLLEKIDPKLIELDK
jgi:glycosyltransferase involved in cell wall biosynthesis